MQKYNKSLVWFRRDLRDYDHAALYHALKDSKQVFCLFIFDTDILNQLQDKADRRVEFIWESLRELKAAFQKNGGDLILQICADDEQVAFHAMRNLVRIGKGIVVPQWTQSGFSGSTASLGVSHTPRNLFGFKDGTANINISDTKTLDQHVWANGADWFAGGSYLAVRLTRMNIETWDRSALREQEQVFGRNKGEGAPLSGGSEMAQPDFTKKNTDGSTAIAKDSHMALAHPSKHGGAKMLRRPYSFSNGIDEVGQINAGLVFLSFQRDLENHFIPVQRALSSNDRMNEYVKVVGSGAFACPPGLKPGQYWGHQLFA